MSLKGVGRGGGDEVMRLRILISPEMRPLTSTALHGAFIVTDDLRAEGFDHRWRYRDDSSVWNQSALSLKQAWVVSVCLDVSVIFNTSKTTDA